MNRGLTGIPHPARGRLGTDPARGRLGTDPARGRPGTRSARSAQRFRPPRGLLAGLAALARAGTVLVPAVAAAPHAAASLPAPVGRDAAAASSCGTTNAAL